MMTQSQAEMIAEVWGGYVDRTEGSGAYVVCRHLKDGTMVVLSDVAVREYASLASYRLHQPRTVIVLK